MEDVKLYFFFDAGSSAMSLGQSLAICFFSRLCGVDMLEEFYEYIVPRPKIDETDFL